MDKMKEERVSPGQFNIMLQIQWKCSAKLNKERLKVKKKMSHYSHQT